MKMDFFSRESSLEEQISALSPYIYFVVKVVTQKKKKCVEN